MAWGRAPSPPDAHRPRTKSRTRFVFCGACTATLDEIQMKAASGKRTHIRAMQDLPNDTCLLRSAQHTESLHADFPRVTPHHVMVPHLTVCAVRVYTEENRSTRHDTALRCKHEFEQLARDFVRQPLVRAKAEGEGGRPRRERPRSPLW